MLSKWINWASLGLLGMAALLFVLSFFAYLSSPVEADVPCNTHKPPLENILPSYFLPLKDTDYEAIGAPLFQVKWNPITLQLPDLRTVLFYYGVNSRPDAKSGAIRLQFGVGPGGGNTTTPNTLATVAPGEPLYLVYERTQGAGRYLFSPNNAKTALWLIAQPEENNAKIELFLQDEGGRRVQEPAVRAAFSLPQKELARSGPSNWFFGTVRVDGTLLARQKARWFGQDLFLNDHGGEEYADIIGKERIEFGEGPDRYLVSVGPDSCLIWKDNRWQATSSVADSTPYPLLCVKKIEERLLRFELWDVDGKARVPLTLLRSTEPWNPAQLQKDFIFMAARTLSQYIFAIRKERTTLRVQDWFVLTKEGWKKLSTPQQIDAYVEEKEPGVLFVFEGVKEKGDVRVLFGMLYNATRSAKAEVEFPLDHSGKSGDSKKDKAKKRRTDTPPAGFPANASNDKNAQAPSNLPAVDAKMNNMPPSRSMPTLPGDEDDGEEDDDGEDFEDLDNLWMDRQAQQKTIHQIQR